MQRLGDRLDMRRGRAAAAARGVDESTLGEIAQKRRCLFGRLVVTFIKTQSPASTVTVLLLTAIQPINDGQSFDARKFFLGHRTLARTKANVDQIGARDISALLIVLSNLAAKGIIVINNDSKVFRFQTGFG